MVESIVCGPVGSTVCEPIESIVCRSVFVVLVLCDLPSGSTVCGSVCVGKHGFAYVAFAFYLLQAYLAWAVNLL